MPDSQKKVVFATGLGDLYMMDMDQFEQYRVPDNQRLEVMSSDPPITFIFICPITSKIEAAEHAMWLYLRKQLGYAV